MSVHVDVFPTEAKVTRSGLPQSPTPILVKMDGVTLFLTEEMASKLCFDLLNTVPALVLVDFLVPADFHESAGAK